MKIRGFVLVLLCTLVSVFMSASSFGATGDNDIPFCKNTLQSPESKMTPALRKLLTQGITPVKPLYFVVSFDKNILLANSLSESWWNHTLDQLSLESGLQLISINSLLGFFRLVKMQGSRDAYYKALALDNVHWAGLSPSQAALRKQWWARYSRYLTWSPSQHERNKNKDSALPLDLDPLKFPTKLIAPFVPTRITTLAGQSDQQVENILKVHPGVIDIEKLADGFFSAQVATDQRQNLITALSGLAMVEEKAPSQLR